ncbi:MAG: alpha/beta fold hydrolase [Candidatus Paceibacterota bacterium]|jgi:pimeloyl-ACP methyl ester carboxylesterase|nr:alpha/beta hydrolase [Candidatus Paceibacterota bacterium]
MPENFPIQKINENKELPKKYASPEDQFSRPKRIRVGTEDVDVYDVSPENTKTDIPTVFAPGFSGTPMFHQQNIIELAKAGRRIISVDSPHGLKNHMVPEEKNGEYSNVELAKLSAVIEALKELQIDKTDVVGHSEGGLYMALAAYLYPERFRNMVLVCPAGMIGKDNLFELVKRNTEKLSAQRQSESARTDEDRLAEPLRDSRIPLNVLLSNIPRSLSSAKAISESDIIDMLKELKQKGINVSVVHGVDDKVFPMERVQRETDADTVTGFYSVQGGHNDIYLTPKQYTAAIDAALDALENKSRADDSSKNIDPAE